MANQHRGFHRLLHRSAEETRACFAIGRETTFGDSVNAFRAKLDIHRMNSNGFQEPPAVKQRLMRKHDAVLRYLEGMMGDYFAHYDYKAALPSVPQDRQDKIWLCWWQGMDNAPEIVRACYRSICEHAGHRDVVVITDKNVDDYVHFPSWLMDKYRSGIISRTHISDLLRLDLLAHYGGLWLDSTFFCCGSLDDPIYRAPLFSIKRPDYLHASIASGYFANYSLGCDNAHRRVFSTIRDYELEYWRRSDFLIDYLLTDYLIVLAQRHNPAIKAAFDAIQPNNAHCDDLFTHLGRPYDERLWSKLRCDTELFKLSWKYSYPYRTNEQITFFGKLIEGSLR